MENDKIIYDTDSAIPEYWLTASDLADLQQGFAINLDGRFVIQLDPNKRGRPKSNRTKKVAGREVKPDTKSDTDESEE